MDVKNLLYETLFNKFGFEVIPQGSLKDGDPYPDNFFTYWNNQTLGSDFFDNEERATVWDFDLNFYTNDFLTCDTVLLQAKDELKKVGFTVTGKGYDVASDEKTHVGRGIQLLYFERGVN